jgi:hypothetical protein
MAGSPLAHAVVSGLMLFLGHGVLDDPQYPWLRPAVAGDSDECAADLLARAKTYARAALADGRR